MSEDRRTYTVDEAAEILGIGRNSAYEAIRRGQIPTLRFGRRVVVPREALEQLLRNTDSETAGPGQNADVSSPRRWSRKPK